MFLRVPNRKSTRDLVIRIRIEVLIVSTADMFAERCSSNQKPDIGTSSTVSERPDWSAV